MNVMFFRRKAYQRLLEWKDRYAGRYAALLEGPRRVGKSTIVKHFAKQEYESSIIIDFAHVTKRVTDCFDDIGDLRIFCLNHFSYGIWGSGPPQPGLSQRA